MIESLLIALGDFASAGMCALVELLKYRHIKYLVEFCYSNQVNKRFSYYYHITHPNLDTLSRAC